MTSLFLAIDTNNIEIIKLLLEKDDIDVNKPYIYDYQFIYIILNQQFKLY